MGVGYTFGIGPEPSPEQRAIKERKPEWLSKPMFYATIADAYEAYERVAALYQVDGHLPLSFRGGYILAVFNAEHSHLFYYIGRGSFQGPVKLANARLLGVSD